MPRRLLPIAVLAVPLHLFFGGALAAAAAPEDTRPAARGAADRGIDPAAIGAGQLLWNADGALIPLPVVDIAVTLDVTGVMARGTLTQTFSNPTAETIEAIYLFPLPGRAAVDGMEMRVGDRRVVAVVQEKAEAERTYEAAKRDGKKASLVDHRRPNLFSTALANINPGERVEVRIEYIEEVACEEGEFSLAFPLTYTPRFLPGSDRPGRTDAGEAEREDGALDAPPPVTDGRFAPAGSPLVPHARIAATIRSGLPLRDLRSPSHAIRVEEDRGAWRIALDAGTVPADRDFVLRWQVERGEAPEGAMFIEEREGERYALLMLVPPAPESEAGWGLPTTTLFIIDVSGSMDGPSIRQARGALRAALDSLRPGDSFNLLRFNDRNEAYRGGFQAVTDAAIEEAKAWVDRLEAGGGTDIAPALLRGLGMLADSDPWPLQRAILITDGAVGNEEDLFRRVSADLGKARFHVIGIGSAPNRFLMRRLALLGRGSCEFIAGPDEIGDRMSRFLGRIDRPVLTDLSLEWEGPAPLEVYPEQLPDLYAGEPLFLSLRLDPGGAATRAVLQGRLGDRTVRTGIDLAPGAPSGSGVATRWARARVDGALDRLHRGADIDLIRAEVVDLALAFNLVTRFSSLVAVEEERSAAGEWRTRPVAAGLPFGSTLAGATLPQGGTVRPLLALAGMLLLALAGVLGLLSRQAIG